MRVPQAAIDLSRHFEGFYARPYICPAGYWTIGYGHLCVKDHPAIDEAQATSYLADDLQIGLRAAIKYCPVLLGEPENKLAAIVDFVFNCGAGALQTSTLRRRVNECDWVSAGDELLRWVRGGGRVLPGLVRRRQAEKDMLLAGAL